MSTKRPNPAAIKKAATMLRQTKDRQEAFLEAYRKIGTIRGACEAIGINRQTVLDWRDKDVAGFHARFEEASIEFTEALETIAHQRAVTTSDTMLIFTLKARKPEVYRERIEHEHKGRVVLDQIVNASLGDAKAG